MKNTSWYPYFKEFLDSEEWSNIKKELVKRDNRGLTILPYSKSLIKKTHNKNLNNTIFRAFEECSYEDCKVVILGLSPYFNIVGNVPVADGLAFSCGNTDKEQPSLKYLYNGLEDEYDVTLSRNPSLKFLANQGVLLLNCALTCQPNMAEVHISLWKPFIEYFFKKVIKEMDDLHIVLYGSQAKQYSKLINTKDEISIPYPNTHWVYKESHPAFYARMRKNVPCENLKKISEKTNIYFDKKLELWEDTTDT